MRTISKNDDNKDVVELKKLIENNFSELNRNFNDVKNKLNEIENKSVFSSFFALGFAVLAIGITSWGISFTKVTDINWTWFFTGCGLIILSYILFAIGVIRSKIKLITKKDRKTG